MAARRKQESGKFPSFIICYHGRSRPLCNIKRLILKLVTDALHI